MDDLYELPSGDWIDLLTVQAIRFYEQDPPNAGTGVICVPHRVIVYASTGDGVFVCCFPDRDAALEAKHEIALAVNQARAAAMSRALAPLDK